MKRFSASDKCVIIGTYTSPTLNVCVREACNSDKFHLITARPPHPKDGEGNSLTLFVSSHPVGGGRYPITERGAGGTPPITGGIPPSSLGWGSQPGMGYPPSVQGWTWDGVPPAHPPPPPPPPLGQQKEYSLRGGIPLAFT